MSGRTTRRHMLKFLAGSAVAIPFTPIPWKLLDDMAIWTQTWDRVPKLPRGKISTHFTTCTLCPASCAVRARCVGGIPVGLSGVAGHPLSFGVLCPLGLGAHQLPYHSRRLAGIVARSAGGNPEPASIDRIVTVLADAIRNRGETATSVALLDARPGRAVSALYRQLVAGLPDGVYLTSHAGGETWWLRLQQMLDRPYGPLGYDLENTRTILSFGSPVLDGWGTPGRMYRMRFGAEARRLQILQVETRPSRTAMFADRWLSVRPGSEGAFALGLAHVIVRERLHDEAGIRARAIDFETGAGADYVSLLTAFPPEKVATLTGLRSEEIIDTARLFAGNRPAIAVAERDPGGGPLDREAEVAIWGLNLLVGSVGRRGGIVPRAGLPDVPGLEGAETGHQMHLADVPDRSLRVLILDGCPSDSALPWPVLQQKLVGADALVVSLSPYFVGHARRATCMIPTPAWLEGFEEAPTPPGASRASLGLSTPMVPAPAQVVDPVEVMRRLARALDISLPGSGGCATLIQARVAAIQTAGRGRVFCPGDRRFAPVNSLGSSDALWKHLCESGVWINDEVAIAPMPSFRLLGPKAVGFRRLAALADGPPSGLLASDGAGGAVLMPYAIRGTAGEGPVTPLASKLSQESGLRRIPGMAVMHPDTGRGCGVRDGGRVRIRTAAGELETQVVFDPQVMSGVVHVAVGPDPDRRGETGENIGEQILELCVAEGHNTWRAAPAQLWEA